MVLLGWHAMLLPVVAPSVARAETSTRPASQDPAPLGPAARLPALATIHVAKGERWTIAEVAAPPASTGRMVTTTVGGRRVTLRGTEELPFVSILGRGDDGALLVLRRLIGEYPAERTTIRYAGRETTVPDGVSHLRDRATYAGSFVHETGPRDYPLSAPESFVVERGRRRALGWGRLAEWGRDGVSVLDVPVDERGQPSGTEFTVGSTARLLRRGADGRGTDGNEAEWIVPGYGFAGRKRDGTVVLVSGGGSGSVGGGYVSVSQEPVANDRILEWRAGAFVAHRKLPAGWRFVGVAPDGWILVRRSAPPAKAAEPGLGTTPEQAEREFDAWSDAQEESMTAGERDWTAGVLRGGVLTPVTFPRPKGTETLLWRDGDEQYGPAAFRFSAFYGDDTRHFRAARPVPKAR